MRKTLRAVTCALVVAFSSLAGGVTAFAVDGPAIPSGGAGMDLGAYCQLRMSYAGVKLVEYNAYGWRCYFYREGMEQLVGINMDDVCHWQYGPATYAAYGDWGNPYSWACYL